MKINGLSIVVALLISGSAIYAQSDLNQDQKVYKIEKRLDNYTRPITFSPTKAIPTNRT